MKTILVNKELEGCSRSKWYSLYLNDMNITDDDLHIINIPDHVGNLYLSNNFITDFVF